MDAQVADTPEARLAILIAAGYAAILIGAAQYLLETGRIDWYSNKVLPEDVFNLVNDWNVGNATDLEEDDPEHAATFLLLVAAAELRP